MADTTDIKPPFDPTQPFQPADDTTGGTGINIRPGGTAPIQAAEKPPFDPTKPFQPADQPQHDFSWGQTYSDIWPEIKKEASSAVSSMVPEVTGNPFTNLANTGKAALAIPQFLASPLTGAARSVMGHTAANLVHAAGEATIPSIADKDDPDKLYEEAKRNTDLALMTLGPEAGGINKVPVVPKAPTPPPSVAPVVAAADRISQVAPAPINVPKAFASDSIAVQRAGQLAKNTPFVGDAIPRATGEMADQLGNAAGSIANEYGQGSGPNVANRIGTTIGNAAEAETNAATNAARTSDDALLADWQRHQDTTHADITNQENTALARARAATGDMSPQDMGQALIERLEAGEQAARDRKDALYNAAEQHDASVQASAVRGEPYIGQFHGGVHDIVSNALYDAGRVIDPTLTPAANSMMNELRNFSNLQIPNRVGPRPPAPGDVQAVSFQGINQTRKRLGNMAQSAATDGDRAAASIIMRQFDNWQTDAFDNALYSGDPAALQAIRDANAANTTWRRSFYNDRDDADKIINKVVTGEVTPQEMSNWLVGTSQIGAKGVSSRLLTRLGEVTANDPAAMDTVRAGVANRLFGNTPGATARTPERVASDINEFFNGSGRDVARRLYTPQQRAAALDYADTLRRAQEARQTLTEVARNTKPSAMPVGPGPMQELATSILGKNGKTDEALFSAIDAYARSGGRGDIKTLADILNNVPAQDKGDLAGAIIRQLGRTTQTKGFALDHFVTEWNKYTPQAKTLLFGNAGPHRQALDDIATIAQRYKEIGRRFGNPSGTGQTVIGAGLLTGLITHPYVTIPSWIGGAILSRMLAAPASAVKTAGLLRNAWEASKSANPLRMAALNASLSNFIKEANRFGANVSLQNAQGPGTSNAKEPQEPLQAPNNPFKRGGKVKGFADGGDPTDVPDDTTDPREQGISIRPAAPASDDLVQAATARLATPPPISEIPDNRPDFIKSLADTPFSEGNASVNKVANKLTSDQPGDPRFQTWPERLVRSGASLAHDVYTGEQPMLKPGLRREDFTDTPPPDQPTEDSTWLGKTLGVPPVAAEPSDPVIQRAQDMAAVGGLGALAGIQEGSAGVFGGKLSKIADHDAMARADQMETSGASPDTIWNQTKTAKAADGQWRQEIDDSQSKLKMQPQEIGANNWTDVLGDVLHHPELYKAYPKASDLVVEPLPAAQAAAGTKGSFNPSTNTIQLNTKLTPDQAKSTLLHEVQHAIQTTEGFAPGDNPSNHIPAALTPARQNFEAVRANTQAEIAKDLNTNDRGVEYMKDLIRREKYGPDAAQQDIPEPYIKVFQEILAKKPDVNHRLSNIVESEKLLADADQKAYAKYKSAMGEVESRNVQNRLAYPQFKRSIPELTEDTPRSKQVDLRGTASADTEQSSAPYFRPALKYNGKIYKAPIGSDEHMDAVPDSIYPELQQKAMTGQDISDYNFGYMNNKGQFMSRESALDYGIKEGLIDPQAGQFGHLSTPVLKQYALYSDSGEAGAPLAALEKTQPFYSQVEKTIQSAPQQKMQGSQWANWLKNQPGVKPDELQATGIDDWLRGQNGPVTKQAVQDYIGNNKIQVGDVEKGNNPDSLRWSELNDKAVKTPAERAEFEELTNNSPNIANPKFADYQLPGGENYREHLITLPKQQRPTINGEKDYSGPGPNYNGKHWEEPNVVAHARTTDRTVDGVPSMHLEEIQSDWAQQGRKVGYKSEAPDLSGLGKKADDTFEELVSKIQEKQPNIQPTTAKSLATDLLNRIDSGEGLGFYSKDEIALGKRQIQERQAHLDAARKELHNNRPPDMPFKQTDQWAGLAMKRMIQKAIDEGKTRVSWTPGEDSPTNPKNLGQTGEQAEKADKGNRTFYNEILPNIVQKLGKKYGVRVQEGETPVSRNLKSKEDFRSWARQNGLPDRTDQELDRLWMTGSPMAEKFMNTTKQQPVHYFDIPSKMREDVLKNGFQLFSDTSKSAPLAALEEKSALPDDFWTWPKSRRDSWMANDAENHAPEPEPEPVKTPAKQSPWQSQKLTLQKRPSRLNKDGSIASDEFKLNDPAGKSVGWLEVIPYENGKKLYVDNVGSFETKGFGPNAFGPSTTRDMLRQLKQHYPKAEQVGGFRISGAREKAGSEREVWTKFEDGGSVFAHVHSYKHKDNIARPIQEGDAEPEVAVPHRAHGGRVLASNINAHPSDAQKESGNYAKDHVRIHGLDLTIENAKGAIRSGVGPNGKRWTVKMPCAYGYIRSIKKR